MAVRIEIDFNSFVDMRRKIEELGGDIETELNQVLKKEGKKTIEPSITNLIPLSKKNTGEHAKTSKWASQKLGNLEITIKAKGSAKKPGTFGYLVFPNEGRGPQNHEAQRFMEKGRDLAVPSLVTVVQEKLIERIEEVL